MQHLLVNRKTSNRRRRFCRNQTEILPTYKGTKQRSQSRVLQSVDRHRRAIWRCCLHRRVVHTSLPVAYRQTDAMPPNQCRPKHPLKVHLWGGISKRGPTQLFVFNGIMESEFYTNEILKNTLKPFPENVYPDGHRLQRIMTPNTRLSWQKTIWPQASTGGNCRPNLRISRWLSAIGSERWLSKSPRHWTSLRCTASNTGTWAWLQRNVPRKSITYTRLYHLS